MNTKQIDYILELAQTQNFKYVKHTFYENKMNENNLENLFQIKKYKNIIELSTNSMDIKNFFLTEEEKINNFIVNIITFITTIITIILPILIFGSEVTNNIFFYIYIYTLGLLIISLVYNIMMEIIGTNVNIRLKFSTFKGLEIIPDKENKNSISIKSKNISEISFKKGIFKYKKILQKNDVFDPDKNKYKHNTEDIKIILTTHTPIISPYNNSEYSELLLIEGIDRSKMSEVKILVEEIKQILNI